MEENIIQSIAKAEEQAAEMRAQAQAEANKIAADAERSAAEILKNAEGDCVKLREKTIKAAEERAVADYDKAIENSRAEAENYADGLIKSADNLVTDIIGRIVK